MLRNTVRHGERRRFSRILTRPISSHSDLLKEAAVVITWGKLVAPGKAPPNLVPGPTLDTPWRASDHHSYPWMPSLGTAAALLTNSLIFSCNVSLPIKSLTLTCNGILTLQNFKLLVSPFFASQAKGARHSTVWLDKQRRNNRNERHGSALILSAMLSQMRNVVAACCSIARLRDTVYIEGGCVLNVRKIGSIFID